MNKSLVTGILIGALVVSAGAAIAGFDLLDRKPKFAEVIDVDPVSETIRTPREECVDQVVTHQQPVKDQRQITGTVIGAVVVGVLGNQVGDGRGQKLATVAGAAAGGYAGNRVQKRIQDGNTYQTTEKQCHTVYDKSEKTVGYDVRYRLGEEEGTVRMDRDPGKRIPVQDGQLVLTQTEAEAQS